MKVKLCVSIAFTKWKTEQKLFVLSSRVQHGKIPTMDAKLCVSVAYEMKNWIKFIFSKQSSST